MKDITKELATLSDIVLTKEEQSSMKQNILRVIENPALHTPPRNPEIPLEDPSTATP